MKKLMIITYSLLGLLLVVFSFLDLHVSQALYREGSVIGNLTLVSIYIPVYFLALVSVLVILRPLLISKIPYKALTHLILGGMYLLIVMVFIYQVVGESDNWFIWLLISLPVLVLGSVLLVLVIPKDDLFNYQKLSVLYLGVFFIMNIGFNAFKFFWVRTRFYHLEDASDFSVWFIPQGFFNYADEYSSMPSGHVGTVALLIGLIFIPLVMDKYKRYLIPVIGVVTFLILFTALGRVIDGKHYVTDTLISMTLVLSMYVYLSRAILVPQIKE